MKTEPSIHRVSTGIARQIGALPTIMSDDEANRAIFAILADVNPWCNRARLWEFLLRPATPNRIGVTPEWQYRLYRLRNDPEIWLEFAVNVLRLNWGDLE